MALCHNEQTGALFLNLAPGHVLPKLPSSSSIFSILLSRTLTKLMRVCRNFHFDTPSFKSIIYTLFING